MKINLGNKINNNWVRLLLILLFWTLIYSVFAINDLPTDGEKKIGIPYPIIISYIDRSNMEVYKMVWKWKNILWDAIFIIITTGFYFYLFKHIKK